VRDGLKHRAGDQAVTLQPRSVKVSIRCEMPPTMRLISLKRRGPPPSSMMTNTLHLSPTAPGSIGRGNRSRDAHWAAERETGAAGAAMGSVLGVLVNLVCSGFKKVPSCAVCDGHSYSVSYNIYQGCHP